MLSFGRQLSVTFGVLKLDLWVPSIRFQSPVCAFALSGMFGFIRRSLSHTMSSAAVMTAPSLTPGAVGGWAVPKPKNRLVHGLKLGRNRSNVSST